MRHDSRGDPPRLADDPAQLSDEPEGVTRLDEALENRELGVEPRRLDRWPRDPLDLRVRARRDHLAVADEHLVELLARRRPDHLDRDLAPGLLAGEADHVLRQVHDPHGLPHVEDVDLPALGDRTGLDDELHGLGDRHEEPGHLRVGHRHRAAPGDLAPEDRDHGARRAEDVAEPHRHEPGRDVRPVPPRLDDPLAERLRLAHDRLRIRSLVGGHEHEPLRTELDGHVGQGPGAEGVVAHRLERVRLHHRDVLVRGRVEDDAGPVGGEDLAQLDAVLDVRHDGHATEEPTLAGELAVDVEQCRLGMIDHHEPRRTEPGELPAELGADRAAGARDHHDLVRDVAGDPVEIDLDRLPAEHVLDLDGPQLGRQAGVACDELGQTGQGLDRQPGLPCGLDDPATHLAGRGRDRDQHLVRPAIANQVRQVGGRAEHPDPVQAQVPLARIVVDDADRRVAEPRVPQHLLDDELGRVAGPDDDRLLAAGHDLARERPLDQRPGEQARARDEREAQEQVDEPDSLRHARRVELEQREDQERGERGERDPAQGRPHVTGRDVAPPAVVEAREREHRQLDRDDDEDHLPVEIPVVVHRQPLVEPEQPGERPRQGDDRRIGGDLPHRVPVERGSHARSGDRRDGDRGLARLPVGSGS